MSGGCLFFEVVCEYMYRLGLLMYTSSCARNQPMNLKSWWNQWFRLAGGRATRCRWIHGRGKHLLCALLLLQHFFFLSYNFCFVFETEGEGEGNEEGGGGDDPDDIASYFSCSFEPMGRVSEARRDGVTGGWRDDVFEGGETVDERLVVVVG